MERGNKASKERKTERRKWAENRWGRKKGKKRGNERWKKGQGID